MTKQQLNNQAETNLAIRLDNVSKAYKLYQSPKDRLKESLHPLKKTYHKKFFALQDINLPIPKGSTFGLIGMNGSGKSTMLKLVCGVSQPSSGSIEVKGRISALLELGSGFNPEFTGKQNIFLNASLMGFSRKEIESRYPDIVNFANIGEFIDQPVKNYSSGMLVRLAFSMAIHVDPDILIIDEALAVGDVKFQHKCMAKIESFKGQSTILFVSHSMNDILCFCDQAVWLNAGRIQSMGDPEEVTNRYLEWIYSKDLKEKEPASHQSLSIQASPGNETSMKGDENVLQTMNLEAIEKQSFGSNKAKLFEAKLVSKDRETKLIYPKDRILLYCRFYVFERIDRPILGFIVKNNLGLGLFGFNNIFLNQELPVFQAQKTVNCSFQFQWPDIISGTYSFSVALAEGTMEDHIAHYWIHNAIIAESVNPHLFGELFNVNGRSIEFSLSES